MTESRLVDAGDVDVILDLSARAFGRMAAAHEAEWIVRTQGDIADGRVTGIYDGTRLVACGRYLAFEGCSRRIRSRSVRSRGQHARRRYAVVAGDR